MIRRCYKPSLTAEGRSNFSYVVLLLTFVASTNRMPPSIKLKPFRDEITHFIVQDRASVADINFS